MPKQRTNSNATFIEQAINRFHEVNDLYNGTLNKVHHFLYSIGISSNHCFTFKQAMEQEYKLSFVDAMEKEFSENKENGNWTVVHCKNLPKNKNPIKEIWYFKQNCKPDRAFLKHKARLCTHGGMQQWGDIYWETYFPVFNMLSVRFSFFWSGLQGPKAYSLWGGLVPSPSIG